MPPRAPGPNPHPGSNVNHSLRGTARSPERLRLPGLSPSLRITNPCPTAVHMEPFSIQSSKFSFNICYYHQDLHQWRSPRSAPGPRPPPRSSYTSSHAADSTAIWHDTEPSIFRSGDSAGELLHTLAIRLPWPPSCCRTTNTFMDLMSVDSGTLTRYLVHSTSPVLLTKNGPLGAWHSAPDFNQASRLTHLKPENRLKCFSPKTSIIRLPDKTHRAPAILRETSEEPATRWFD